jgi:hypothetical protein
MPHGVRETAAAMHKPKAVMEAQWRACFVFTFSADRGPLA